MWPSAEAAARWTLRREIAPTGTGSGVNPVWLALIAAPIVGSFLGVLVVRLPEGEGVVLGRSRCRSCNNPLGPVDLVPLFGWLLRRGRCRYCGARISLLYPAIEIAAILVVVWAAPVVPGDALWASAILGWTLVALAAIDLRVLILPDALTLPLAAIGLFMVWQMTPEALPSHVVGAGLGWMSFRLLAALYARVRGRAGLGHGDAKLMAAAGAWVGWQALPTVVLFAALAALAAVALSAGVGRRIDATTRIPFGPFLALGLWLTWLYGPLLPGPSALSW
ncbi:MAG: prepilin peptidase [Rhodospirillales bacterium]|nr:prepilin peptidase [Rhodospirillales bacterium]